MSARDRLTAEFLLLTALTTHQSLDLKPETAANETLARVKLHLTTRRP